MTHTQPTVDRTNPVAARRSDSSLNQRLANLAGADGSHAVAADGGYPPKFINPYEIDRDRLTALCGERLDEVLQLLANYTGENAYAVRAVAAAREWIKERRNDAHPPLVT